MKYSWSAPEVMQTSSMDCGPACLKSLLQGLNIPVNYGRLREACQTDVDGTSIDTLEELACELGLDAQQVLIPLHHLPLPEAQATPAILISQLPNHMTHFIVIWRSLGPWVQIMDPSHGRHWITWEKLKQIAYLHGMSLPTDTWLNWTGSDEYRLALKRRLVGLGISADDAQGILATVFSDTGTDAPQEDDVIAEESIPSAPGDWKAIATFDAGITWTEALRSAGALKKGREAMQFLRRQQERAQASAEPWAEVIPRQYWWVIPDDNDPEAVRVEATVLVRVTGVTAPDPATSESPASSLNQRVKHDEPNPWSLLLTLLLPEQRTLLRWFVPVILLSAATITLQALLFQGLLNMNNLLGQQQEFNSFIPMMFLFIVLSVLLDIPVTQGALSLGRQVEMQFRIRLFNKLPKIHDPYFRSRLLTDMASRSHKLYVLRIFPSYLVALVQQTSLILFTLIGIIWLDTTAGIIATVMVIVLMAATLFWQTLLSELEARAEVQSGVINMLYFDALKGLKAIRSHAAQATIQTEQEIQLNRWAQTHYDHQRNHMGAMLLMDIFALLCVAGIMLSNSANVSGFAPSFLWLYWLLRLPFLVKQLGLLLLDLPPYKVSLGRYAELLGATEVQDLPSDHDPVAAPVDTPPVTGVAITLTDLSLVIAGHPVLNQINLSINPGQHIAVVGASGAGKSSLCELLLGWQAPSEGQILVDGMPLEAETLLRLREQTAWVDANVQLWDRSLLENLHYDHGNGRVNDAGLGQVLTNLPDGLQTPLGEGGKRLSGGEGQRVRIARALGVENARLVILDEPCRGLDRPARQQLLEKLRSIHARATLICITHDISEAIKFPHVVVMGEGGILEQGAPEDLLAQPDGALAQLQHDEQQLLQALLGRQNWQQLHMHNGHLQAQAAIVTLATAADAPETRHV